MKSYVKLIHRSNISYFPSAMPVHFYGLPDGKVYIIYARFYEVQFDRTYLEFVFARHKEFSFDYEQEQLIPHDKSLTKYPVYNEIVDKPDPKVDIIKTFRNINSYAEAFNHLNKKAQLILSHPNKNEGKPDFSDNGINDLQASA